MIKLFLISQSRGTAHLLVKIIVNAKDPKKCAKTFVTCEKMKYKYTRKSKIKYSGNTEFVFFLHCTDIPSKNSLNRKAGKLTSTMSMICCGPLDNKEIQVR